MVTIGEKLRRARISLGLSQKQMAAGIVSPSFYSRVENGVSKISATNLIKILAVHNLSVAEFLGGDRIC